MATAISVQQLAVTFPARGRQPAVAALRPIDFEVARGRIVGVLGPNGSGKSTLLRALAGRQRPTSGQARVLGLPPDAPELLARVGWQPEGPLPLDVLSAREFLQWVGAELGLSDGDADARIDGWLRRLDLARAGARWIRTFSTGMQKRLALAAALLADPEVLLLDEPTAGLDPFGSELVMQILRERAAAGAAVLMASHHLLEVEEICDEVFVLQDGAIQARGTLADLLGGDASALVVRGLDEAGLRGLADDARARGGDVLRVERPRDHLFALFRRLRSQQPPEPR